MFIPADIWFRAFVLTLAVEIPIAVVLLRRWEPGYPRLLALIVLANLASHPVVWFVLSQVLLIGTLGYVLVAEGWAIACETVFYWAAVRGLSARRALIAALATNAASFLVGRLVVTAWPELFW